MPKIMRLPQVIELTTYKRSSIYRLMDEGKFPKPIKIGARAVAWLEEDINLWLESKIQGGR